jgi:hypothetical protein
MGDPILRSISGDEKLTIRALDGRFIIVQAKNIFRANIDPHFIQWRLSKLGIATPEISVRVYEMIKDASFADIFNSLPGTLEQKWLTQNQVIEFCAVWPDWLRSGGFATMFLCKNDESQPIDEANPQNNLMEVGVSAKTDGLSAVVNHFDYTYVWAAKYRRRVVVPVII